LKDNSQKLLFCARFVPKKHSNFLNFAGGAYQHRLTPLSFSFFKFVVKNKNVIKNIKFLILKTEKLMMPVGAAKGF
jgi:hypothetical protein